MIKIYIQYSEFRAHSVFQGKHKLLKNPECKAIFNTVKNFRANSVFQGKRKLFKILNDKNTYSQLWIQGTLCFSGQAKVAQTSGM